MNVGRRIRWIVLYPVLAAAGINTLGTGCPIPLWHIERLNDPVLVRSIAENHLQLQDGRKVTLPFIKEIPRDDTLFQEAISNGVEVSASGEVYGLLFTDRNCAHDPVVWRKLRVDLSLLAGALHPAGIDDSLVHPEAIAFIQENYRIDLSQQSRSHQKNHLSAWDWGYMRAVERVFPRPPQNVETPRREMQ